MQTFAVSSTCGLVFTTMADEPSGAADAPLSPDQIRAVQASWEIIMANSEENGTTLIKR